MSRDARARRIDRIDLRVTVQEMTAITTAASAAGLTISDYVRDTVHARMRADGHEVAADSAINVGPSLDVADLMDGKP